METGSSPSDGQSAEKRATAGGPALARAPDPLRVWRRLLRLPRALAVAQGDARRHHALRRGVRERHAPAPALPARDAGDVGRAGAVLLRADQPALHPRPSAGQERGPAVSGPWIRGVHHRLGRARPAGTRALTLEHYVCGFLEEAVEFILRERAERTFTCSATAWAARCPRCSRPCSPRSSGASPSWPRPSSSGVTDSLLNLWTDRAHFDVDAFVERAWQLPRVVSPGLLPEHETGTEPAAEEHLDVREPRGSPVSVATTSRWSSGSTTTSPSPVRRFACS